MAAARKTAKLSKAVPRVLVDSDVWIDFLRGNADAQAFVASLPDVVFASAVTVAELHVGVREGAERRALDQLIETLTVLDVTPSIAGQGGLLRRDWGRSHGVGLNDALIAATVLEHDLQLATLNVKHYPMLKGAHLKAAYRKAA